MMSLKAPDPDENKIAIQLDSYPNIKRYLGAATAASIVFPNVPPDCARKTPIALDGASGVGKTQQAFVLLKTYKNLVYMTVAFQDFNDPSVQKIYSEMHSLTFKQKNSLQMIVKNAVEKLKNAAEKKTEPFSEATLKNCLNSEMHEARPSLLEVLTNWYNMCIFYNDANGGSIAYFHQTKTPEELDWTTDLSGKILFLDEALPSDHEEENIETLRLLRNLGCTVGMQAIAAGTASVIANMIKPSNKHQFSRKDFSETCFWMACRLYFSTMGLEAVKALLGDDLKCVSAGLLHEMLSQSRPLLVHAFKECCDGSSLVELLEAVGTTLMETKTPPPEALLSWLMGTWLETRRLTTSPFPIKPPTLVSKHFFEPAVRVYADTRIPYLQKGVARTENLTEVGMDIFKVAASDQEKGKHGAWAISGEKTSLSSNFEDISSALSACVQQCLSREPLLAIALSHRHRYESSKDFQDAMRHVQEATAEYNLGAMSGEQIEATVFAALQQANGTDLGARRTLPDFCRSLVDFLEVKDPFLRGIKAKAMTTWGIAEVAHSRVSDPNVIVAIDYGNLEGVESVRDEVYAKQEAKERKSDDPAAKSQKVELPSISLLPKAAASGYRMPWLVPASSHKKPDWVQGESAALTELKGLHVAGLIHGETGARCDISAYGWPIEDHHHPLWKFEVKGRSDSYSMNDGMTDLMTKCGDTYPEGGHYHAMLIAIRGQTKSAVKMWQIEKSGLSYARAVVLVAATA